ncbi:S1C family serine protease [Nocardia brasiliensis]|uniref:S1C family serine protease n=1 Tax=Nocardia brasiliensis TaxID=37326 RepID=UPI003671A740
MKRRGTIAAVAAIVVVAGCADQPDRQGDNTQTAAPAPTLAGPPVSTGYVELVDRVGPSVVTVEHPGGVGSGVVIRSDVIVTNAHVVGDASTVTITLENGDRLPGVVLAADRMTDLAVVRTERKNLPIPEFRSGLPEPGEIALAIGSPLGFQNSVSAGVVSGIQRSVPGAAQQAPALVDLIQTDAPISPGNSGGALLDVHGRVVGINEAYIPPSVGAVSLGFAIPSATVLDVVDQLLTKGAATHPYLGVSAGRITPQIQEMLGVPAEDGALVVGVDPGAPAAAAGLRPGDVIIEFAGKPVRTVEDLLSVLRRLEPGSQQPLVFLRGAERQQVTLTIGARTD